MCIDATFSESLRWSSMVPLFLTAREWCWIRSWRSCAGCSIPAAFGFAAPVLEGWMTRCCYVVLTGQASSPPTPKQNDLKQNGLRLDIFRVTLPQATMFYSWRCTIQEFRNRGTFTDCFFFIVRVSHINQKIPSWVLWATLQINTFLSESSGLHSPRQCCLGVVTQQWQHGLYQNFTKIDHAPILSLSLIHTQST